MNQMAKQKNRARVGVVSTDEDPYQFEADFDSNFRRKKKLSFPSLFRGRRGRNKQSHLKEREKETTLLCGIDEVDPEMVPTIPSFRDSDSDKRNKTSRPSSLNCAASKSRQQSTQSQQIPASSRLPPPSFPPATNDLQNEYHELEDKIDTPRKQELPEEGVEVLRLERPDDPRSLQSVLRNLPLVEFEKIAQERANAKVFGWLFDHGLIDELLIYGGTETSKKPSSVHRSSSSASADRSVLSFDSQPSSEGVEVGMVSGKPMEKTRQLDTLMVKFKSYTKQQLQYYNSKLTEGDVAISGFEVRELVHAIHHQSDTNDGDVGRLGELSTYVTNTQDAVDPVLLEKYPRLKDGDNARRNLKKCFNEVDYFYQIPGICERLKEHLKEAGHDCLAIRDIANDHIDLEVYLVEIERSMKRNQDEATMQKHRRRGFFIDESKLLQIMRFNHNRVDKFLYPSSKPVWLLGEIIRTKILVEIGRSFDMAMNSNPDGFYSLVEAVELYETIYERHFKTEKEQSVRLVRFANARSAVLKQLYNDFEQRSLRIFREVFEAAMKRHEEMAKGKRRNYDKDDYESDSSDDTSSESSTESEASNPRISSALAACNYLTAEIMFMQQSLSPKVPNSWALDILWSSRVTQICSQKILNEIGGPQGTKLSEMTVTELLDLVAWVETFRETLLGVLPDIPSVSKRSYFTDHPQLLIGGSDAYVDMSVAKDALAWANNMLWDVHDLAKDEFLIRTKEQTDEWLDNVYLADHTKIQSEDGKLITSLCEDVYSLAGVQLRTIRERVTRNSEALVQALGVIIRNLYEKQIACRNNFLDDFETCCAAANDFLRMIEKCDAMLEEVNAECNLTKRDAEALSEQAAILAGLYSSDAIFASQKLHLFIFSDVEGAIADNLFTDDWVEATYNQYALTLVRTVEDFMSDLQVYTDKIMVGKSLEALVKATVIFYVKCIVQRSTKFKTRKRGIWTYSHRALDRMKGDIMVMRQYYEGLVPTYPALQRTIDTEFQILDIIHELLMIAAGLSRSTERDFIILLQKHIKNSTITKYVVGDLWHLVQPTQEKALYELVDSIEAELLQVAPNDEQATISVLARQTVPGLRLDLELAKLCDESRTKRLRPGMKRSTTERSEIMLNEWRVIIQKQVKKQVKKLDKKIKKKSSKMKNSYRGKKRNLY